MRLGSLLVVLTAGLAGSWPATEAASQASAGGRYRIDFRVLDRDGVPVRHLRPEEVRVTIGGRQRRILYLHAVESRRGRSAPGAPRPFATSDDARAAADLYLVVDERGLTVPAAAKLAAAVDALTGALADEDRVGLLSLRPHGPSLAPGTAREVVRSAIAAMTPGAAPCGGASNMEALAGLIRGRIDDAPAIFLVFSGGGPGCGIDAGERARLEAATHNTPVEIAFFPLWESTGISGADAAAGSTGRGDIGPAEDLSAAMRRLARETSVYYLAAVDLEPGDRDGSTQPLEIRVSRPDVRVITRSSVVMPPGGRPLPALLAREMARHFFPYREFTLRAAAYTSSNHDGQVKLVVLCEPDDEANRLSGVSLALFDTSGVLVRQATATAEDLRSQPAAVALVAPPGRYVLRVAATDTARRGAAVNLDVNARLTPAGGITLSALAFGGADVLAFEPRLVFREEPSVTAYLELYNVPAGAALRVRFELAAAPDGPALTSMPAMLPPSTSPARIATGAIPIAALAPGDYIVRALVSIEGQLVGSTSGAIRKR